MRLYDVGPLCKPLHTARRRRERGTVPAEVEAWMKKSYIRVRERAMRTAGAAEADIMPVEAAAQLYHCYAKRRRS